MKIFKVLAIASLLALFTAGVASAGGDDVADCIDHDDVSVAPVPEPSAALIMVAGLTTVAAARRFGRRR